MFISFNSNQFRIELTFYYRYIINIYRDSCIFIFISTHSKYQYFRIFYRFPLYNYNFILDYDYMIKLPSECYRILFLFIYKHVYSSRSMYFYPSSRLTQNPHSSSVQNSISCNLDGMVGDLILLCTSIQNLFSSWHNSFPSPTSPHFRVKISRS